LDQHQERDCRDEPVIGRRGFQIEAEQRRAGDAAKPVLTAGNFRPAKRNRIEHRRQRQRQQREIDAAPPQDQIAERGRNYRDDQGACNGGTEKRIMHPVALDECGRIGREPKPGAMAKRHQPGIADQDVERHAGDCEDHDLGGRRHREPERKQDLWQHDEGNRGDQQRNGQAFPHACRLTRTA